MNADDSLWDIDEVSQYLKLTKDTIYRWIDKKQMPAIKIGKKWLFRRNEIDAWLDGMDHSRKAAGMKEMQ